MNFVFDRSVICPGDPSCDENRFKMYEKYYVAKYMICNLCSPNIIAEIGVRAGYSAWSFLKARPNAHYYGFDANNGKHGGLGGTDGKFKKWAMNILKDYNVSYFEIDTQSIDVLPIDDKIDFFHVDGDHSYNGVIHDLVLAAKSISKNGYILIDDIDYIKDVKEAAFYFLRENKNRFESIYLPSFRGELLLRQIA